jgi:outer membrane protein OmpA-like peptidoglycan-associated protein/tetratricopeptide (TPR) repeat protein
MAKIHPNPSFQDKPNKKGIAVWRHCFLLGGLLLGISIHLTAQQPNTWIIRGDKAFAEGDYAKAIDYYAWAEQKSSEDAPENWKAAWGLAKCHRALMDYDRSRPYLAKVVDQPGAPIESYFYYGQSLLATRDYLGAEQWFQRYAQASPQDPRAIVFRGIDQLVAAVMRDSAQYEVQYLPINSKWSDFSPAYYQNGILFVSARPNEIGVLHTSTINDAPLLDLFFAVPDTQGGWSRPKPFEALNSKLNEGPSAVDSLHGNLFVTRNDPEHQKHRAKGERAGVNRLQIDVFQALDGAWKQGPSFPVNNSRYAVGHPACAKDGTQKLYFASDMPGGYGGTDLYMTELRDGNWLAPVNLGPKVNTPEDELFPFIDADNQLYFASNGHLGLGGLDLFTARQLTNSEWTRVQNLGYPLNSQADDFGLILSEDGKNGFLSSNRKGDPQDDNIYAFKRFWPRFECNPMIANNYCFKFWETGVLDADTMPLAYEWSFGDGFKARGLEARHCFDGPGTYAIELNLIDTVLGIPFLNQSSYILEVRDTQQVTITCPERISTGTEFTVSAANSVLQGCTIESYYWEMGDGKRYTAQQFTHRFDAPGTYEIRLGVIGEPEESGGLVCKNCVTKTIVVLPEERFEQIEDSLRNARKQMLDQQKLWENPPIGQNLQDAGTKKFDQLDSAKTGKFTVRLMETRDSLDPKSPMFKGFKNVREVRTADGFETYTGLEDSMAAIRPVFIAAHKQGFDDAIVVVVKDANSSGPQKVVTLPAKRTDLGYTIFSGKVRDIDGNPLQAEITIEDLEHLEVYKSATDSLGNLFVRLNNGRIYVWSVEADDYFPATGYLDLAAPTQFPKNEVRLRHHIEMREMSELLASGDAVRVNNIFFDFDSDHLRPESMRQLDRLAALLKKYPEYGVQVMAHTDNWGNDTYNLGLSNRRAASVLRYMTQAGYDISHIQSQGFGESKPEVPNDSPEHRQFNRRVEFRFYPIQTH